jgi:hypothetical protein
MIPVLFLIFRAINVPLAHRSYASRLATIVLIGGLLGLDVAIDGVRDRPVCAV